MIFPLTAQCHGLERKLTGNEKFSWRKNSKFKNTFFQFYQKKNLIFVGFHPRGHLMDYHLPNMDNRGHLANYHLPHFVHVVIEQPLN